MWFCRSGGVGVAAEVTQTAHVIEGSGNLAVSALGADVLYVFVELIAFGKQVGTNGVLVVEVEVADGLRDDAEDACEGVVFLPSGSDAWVMNGEQGDAVAVVAEVVGVRAGQAAGNGSEVVQFGRIESEAFLREQGGIGRILEEVGAVVAVSSGVGRDLSAQDVRTGSVVFSHDKVRVGPGPQPAAAVVRIGAEPAGGKGVVAKGEDAPFLVNVPGGSGVGKAFQGGLFVEGESGVLF